MSTFIECAGDVATSGWKVVHIQNHLRSKMHVSTNKRVSSQTSLHLQTSKRVSYETLLHSMGGCRRPKEALRHLFPEGDGDKF